MVIAEYQHEEPAGVQRERERKNSYEVDSAEARTENAIGTIQAAGRWPIRWSAAFQTEPKNVNESKNAIGPSMPPENRQSGGQWLSKRTQNVMPFSLCTPPKRNADISPNPTYFVVLTSLTGRIGDDWVAVKICPFPQFMSIPTRGT